MSAIMMCSSLKSRVGIARDRDGTAAVEFALVLPLLVTLFLGSFEITNLLLADLKLTDSVETAADLVAQTQANTVLSTARLDAIAAAAQQVMTPLPGAQLKLAFASVTYQNPTAVLDWFYQNNSATALTLAAISAKVAAAGPSETMLSLGAASSNDSLIVVQATYTYTSPISYVLRRTYTLTEWAFNRPRYVACIPLPGTAGVEGALTTCP
jgi:Flp pilus assembly protein TadG